MRPFPTTVHDKAKKGSAVELHQSQDGDIYHFGIIFLDIRHASYRDLYARSGGNIARRD
jgi:hypothetical protein